MLAYRIWVGGDAWEWWGHGANRFVTPVMPLVFVATGLLLAHPRRRALAAARPRLARALLAAALFALPLVALEMQGGPGGVLVRDTFHATGLHVRDDEAEVRYALALRSITRSHATIAVTWAGAVPYFSGRRAIDLLGRSDRDVARTPPHASSAAELRPGHDKYDLGSSITEIEPDVVAHCFMDVCAHVLEPAYDAVPHPLPSDCRRVQPDAPCPPRLAERPLGRAGPRRVVRAPGYGKPMTLTGVRRIDPVPSPSLP